MAQWLRIRLPRQRTRVRALVWEDPTCRGATKPVPPQLLSLCSRAREPRAVPATREATAMRSLRTAMKSSPRSPQLEKARAATKTQCSQKNKFIKKKKKKETGPPQEGRAEWEKVGRIFCQPK